MVTRVEKDNRKLFQCDECKFIYKEIEIAAMCEKWCREHHSCSIEITRFAVR